MIEHQGYGIGPCGFHVYYMDELAVDFHDKLWVSNELGLRLLPIKPVLPLDCDPTEVVGGDAFVPLFIAEAKPTAECKSVP